MGTKEEKHYGAGSDVLIGRHRLVCRWVATEREEKCEVLSSALPSPLLGVPLPFLVPLAPTRRAISGAPPCSHRPTMGWAQSCTVDEPAGLRPPALGFHRTCSGEQPHWTGSGEPLKVELSHGGALGWSFWGPCEEADGICLSLPMPSPSFWVSGVGETTLSRFYVFTMLNVCLASNVAGTCLVGKLDCDVEPDDGLVSPCTALSISIVRRGMCVELKPSGVPGFQAIPYACLPQPHSSCEQISSAEPNVDILSSHMYSSSP